jgi:hypothetical protein
MKSHAIIIKKTRLIFFTIWISSCFQELALAQGNLVVNGSFDTNASDWIITNVSGLGGYQSNFGNPAGSVALYNAALSSNNIPTASQEINSLTPGSLYIVSGDYLGGGKDTTHISFEVTLNNIVFFETAAPPDSFDWNSFIFYYTATSTSALLSLSAQINGTDYSYNIDNISIHAVPEPSAWSLILLGGGVSFYVRTRKQHSA